MATNMLYVPIRALPTSSTGKRRVIEFHLDDNHEALNLAAELINLALFEQGGLIKAGSVTLDGTTFSFSGLHAGVTLNLATALIVSGGSHDVAGEPDGKHRLAIAAQPTLTDRSYTDPETGEVIVHQLPSGVGVFSVVHGTSTDYPSLTGGVIPVLKFEMSGGSVASWEIDLDYIAALSIGLLARAGATGDRPANPPLGITFFDTDLGKPIWWNGSAWVDATGASV